MREKKQTLREIKRRETQTAEMMKRYRELSVEKDIMETEQSLIKRELEELYPGEVSEVLFKCEYGTLERRLRGDFGLPDEVGFDHLKTKLANSFDNYFETKYILTKGGKAILSNGDSKEAELMRRFVTVEYKPSLVIGR